MATLLQEFINTVRSASNTAGSFGGVIIFTKLGLAGVSGIEIIGFVLDTPALPDLDEASSSLMRSWMVEEFTLLFESN